jgi:molybdopterin-binding protein
LLHDFIRIYIDFETNTADSLMNEMTLLTPREAASRLGVSYPTIKQWIYKGSIRTRQTAGGHHRVPAAEIDRLLAGSGRALPEPRRGGAVIVTLSGRNQLRGVVEEIRVEGLLAQVRLRVGDQRLTAIITRDAVDELKLTRGDEAVAVVKATEVMIARAGAALPSSKKRRHTRTHG